MGGVGWVGWVGGVELDFVWSSKWLPLPQKLLSMEVGVWVVAGGGIEFEFPSIDKGLVTLSS